MLQLVVFLGMVLSSSALVAETGIDDVIRLVETRYSVRHQGVPLLWITKPFLLGSGAGGLKIATFEGFNLSLQDTCELDEHLGRVLGPQWSRFVEARSRRDGEWTVIYSRPIGSKLRLLIATAERNDFTLLQMDVKGKSRQEWLVQPISKTREQERRDRQATSSAVAR